MKNILIVFTLYCTITQVKSQSIKQNHSYMSWVVVNGGKYAPSYTTLNCVSFMYKTMKDYFNLNLSTKQYKQFMITELSEDEYVKNFINKMSDSIITKKMAGFQKVLIELGGVVLNTEEIETGDYIQYWENIGTLEKPNIIGHCGLVYGIHDDGTVILLGSHVPTDGSKTPNFHNPHTEKYDSNDKNGGFGYMNIGKLSDSSKVVFGVRYKKDIF